MRASILLLAALNAKSSPEATGVLMPDILPLAALNPFLGCHLTFKLRHRLIVKPGSSFS